MKLPGLPSPWLLVAWLLSLIVLGVAAYIVGGRHTATRLEAKQLSDSAIARMAADAVATDVVAAVASHKGKTVNTTVQAETIIKENTIYHECKIGDDLKALIEQAGQR